MSWIQLELSIASAQLDELESLLLDAGAVAISLVSDHDEPVLEPQPGETPLWKVIRLQALFELSADLKPLRSAMQGRGFSWDVQFIGEQDWQHYARTFAVDHVFANRLRLRPPLAADDSDDGKQTDIATLFLEPGMAFGSGSHPTTRMCLTWLARHLQPGSMVLDFGCGSGVLAIAAALLGARCHAVDHDDQALLATRENATTNQIRPEQLEAWTVAQWNSGKVRQYDVVVANILAEPLKSLADEFQAHMNVGAAIVLSGILAEQAADVMAAYDRISFGEPLIEDGWICLSGTRDDR